MRITSQGFVHLRPATGSGRTIWINADGIGGSGSEPTVRPSSNLFGFIGTTSHYWYRMYAGQFITPSTFTKKHNIEKLNYDFYSLAYNTIKSLDLFSYNYIRNHLDSSGNVVHREILPERKYGIIAEYSPSLILDETQTGVDLYSYINFLTAAFKEMQNRYKVIYNTYKTQQEEIENLKNKVQMLEMLLMEHLQINKK